MANINFTCDEDEYELFWRAKADLLGARGTWEEFFFELLKNDKHKFSLIVRQKLGDEPSDQE